VPKNLARPLSRCQSGGNEFSVRTEPEADTGFVGPQAYTILGALFKKKNTKFGLKVDIYL
jgi:hypothetical protein